MDSKKEYKLHFFEIRGRAEMIRMIFAYAGVEFEDFRTRYEDFVKIKHEYPFGQLPVLEVDGKYLAQSLAIGRYLAREFGLAGKNNLESAICDMVMDGFQDLMRSIGMYMSFQIEEKDKKKRMFDNFFNKRLPAFLKCLERIVGQSEGKYLVGNSITWADLQIGYLLDEYQKHSPSCLDNYPILKELCTEVLNELAIKEWYATRPPPSEYDKFAQPDVFYKGDFVCNDESKQ